MKAGWGTIRLGAALGVLAAISAPSPSRAEGDIVYSARYYLPGTRPSHHHVWRINPDGSGRRTVTSGRCDDHGPVWLADRRTIFFMRECGDERHWCTVADSGGPVTVVGDVPARAAWWWWTSPTGRSIAYIADMVGDATKVNLLEIQERRNRLLGAGYHVTWNPSGRRFYMSECSNLPDSSASVIDILSGSRVPLKGLPGAAAWLDDETLVVEEGPARETEHPRLVVVRADGTRLKETPLPFGPDDVLPPFADAIHAVPGRSKEILYGRHAGNSTDGPLQDFYRVNLETKRVDEFVSGRDLAWSPYGQQFLTGEGRGLDELEGNGTVWTSGLFLVSLRTGRAQPIVEGLVEVGGFDWR